MWWKWSRLKVPSFGSLEDKVWTTEPALSTSIFTFDPTSPVDVQVIAWVEPWTQDSPPLGARDRDGGRGCSGGDGETIIAQVINTGLARALNADLIRTARRRSRRNLPGVGARSATANRHVRGNIVEEDYPP